MMGQLQTITRRVVPSDPSCVFNAVGYVMEHSKHRAPELREIVAGVAASDPGKYNEALLGKPNEEYCGWILQPTSRGGAIELSILADYYSREIARYDIRTSHRDLYGEGKQYNERVMLIYDGLQYDALALAAFQGASEEIDQTIFPLDQKDDIEVVEKLVLNLIKDAQRKGNYPYVANYTLHCSDCKTEMANPRV